MQNVNGDSVAEMYLKRLDRINESAPWDGIWEAEH
jgi:hypothetical protein